MARTPHERRKFSPFAAFGIALLLGAATYGGWLAWDTEYYYDPIVGTDQGPYRPAQVVGCAITFGLVTALLAARTRPVAAASGMTLGFWVLWTIQAGMTDETGLFVVGSIVLLGGLIFGSAIAGAAGHAIGVRVRTQKL